MKDDQVIMLIHVTMKIMLMIIMLMIIMIINGVAPSLVCVWLEGDGAVDQYDLH